LVEAGNARAKHRAENLVGRKNEEIEQIQSALKDEHNEVKSL